MGVIVISPKFYNYHVEIKNALKKKYNNVILMNEIPYVNIGVYSKIQDYSKGVISFLWYVFLLKIKRIVSKNSISVIFIIRGYYIPEDVLRDLKQTFPKLKIFYYQWDSVQNNPNSLKIAKYAEKSFTFDFNDSIHYQNVFTYLPLYYHWPDNSDKMKPCQSDVLLLSSWSEYRQTIVENLKTQLKDLNLNWQVYFYLPPITVLKYICTGKYNRVKNVHIVAIDKLHYLSLLKGCKAVLDIPSSQQSGASIRVIEALSMGKKIISTNHSLSTILFKRESNNILNYKNFSQYKEFLLSPFCIEDDLTNIVLSLDEWLNRIGI